MVNKSVIILAAGLGSRLDVHGYRGHKCNLKINSETLIHRLVRQLCNQYTIKEIVIVVGHLSESIEIQFQKNTMVQCIRNDQYRETNNMYSCYLGMQKINARNDLIIVNADCVFDDNIIRSVSLTENTSILVDRSMHSEEAMKVKVKNNVPVEMSKELDDHLSTNFVSLDIYNFSSGHAKTLCNIIKNFISKGEINLWTEVAISHAMKEIQFSCKNLDNLRWAEIDNEADYRFALELFNDE